MANAGTVMIAGSATAMTTQGWLRSTEIPDDPLQLPILQQALADHRARGVAGLLLVAVVVMAFSVHMTSPPAASARTSL